MRRCLHVVIALLAIGVTGLARADFSLTVIHTNDFHARFEPINKYDSGCNDEDDEAGKCFGGTARLAKAIAEVRQQADHSILVDGGDQFQGTLFYTHYKGKVAAEMMNTLGYDAMTVGNHEFDDGPEVLRSFVDTVEFPVLMSNADLSIEPRLQDAIKPTHIIERGGEKVGLIGLTPQDTDELSSPGETVTFTEPISAVQKQVEALKREGIDKIIVLSHSGYGVDVEIANAVKDIDIIVGGHSNTLLSNTHEGAAGAYPTMVNGTAIVQAYAYGKYLGVLNVVFDDAGRIKTTSGDTIVMDNAVAEDDNIVQRLGELAAPLEKIRNQVVSSAVVPINGERDVCRVQECEMGNLVADAMLARVKDQGVSIAIQNSGGVRASIDAGDVTMGEVLTVLPFLNTLATFQLKGKDVVAALENGVSQVEDVSGRFPQVAGIQFSWDPSVAPGAGRVTEVMVGQGDDWQPIDPEADYGVVSNNFMRSGGDGYRVFVDRAANAYDFGPGLEQVLADYLADHLNEHGPYKPYLDGRIKQR